MDDEDRLSFLAPPPAPASDEDHGEHCQPATAEHFKYAREIRLAIDNYWLTADELGQLFALVPPCANRGSNPDIGTCVGLHLVPIDDLANMARFVRTRVARLS